MKSIMRHLNLGSILPLAIILNLGILSAQVPDGGIRLNTATGTTYQKIGRCTVSEVAVTDQVFTKAIRVQTGSDMANAWDAQLKFPALEGVEKGDAVLVAFYARTVSSLQETGEGFLNVIIEHNVSYTKEMSHSMSIGSEWKEYYAPVEIGNTLATTFVSYLFHMGFNSQTVEVAEVRFLNYKNTLDLADLPITETTYIGQPADASWRLPAQERIGQVRKGRADITVYDHSGEPLKEAAIHIEMIQHQFGFGTAVTANRINTDQAYRQHLFDLFNEAVFENDLKWPPFVNTSTRISILRALDTLDAHHLPVRGHNIIWPSYQHMPAFMEELAVNPEGMRMEIDDHIDEVTAFTSGRLVDWDVLNEPYTEHDVQDILGDEVMADWFRRTRRNDRGVKLYINDYAILSGGGRNLPKQDYYYDVVRYIDSLGGGIDGIGMQGHFGSDLTSIEKVYEILDRFSSLEKEIKITEFDIDLNQPGVQADYTRDFMTICFSHPAVKSILVWGFWAGAHWKPEAAFYDQNWNLRPHGEEWRKMIKEEWWTTAQDTVTDSLGNLSFEGFLGTYSYSVSDGDTVRSGTFTLGHSHLSGLANPVLISMDPSFPDAVRITSSRPGFICEGEQVTLHATEGEGLSYAWTLNGEALDDPTAFITARDPGAYRVTVTGSGISMESDPYLLEVRPLPVAGMKVEGESSFCPGEVAVLQADTAVNREYEWYWQESRVQWGGTSYETDLGGNYSLRVTDNGCSAISEPVDLVGLSSTDPRCATGMEPEFTLARIYPNPCNGSVQVELASAPGTGGSIELYDATGKMELSVQVEPGATSFTLPVASPGPHLLRIVHGESVNAYRLIAE